MILFSKQMEGDDGDDNDRQVQKAVKAECHQCLPEALRKVLIELKEKNMK